jgi:hypothetical protein
LLVLMGAGLLLVLGTTAARSADSGPPLSEPATTLAASLVCSPDLAAASVEPVLLVHGTASGSDEFAWNWVPELVATHTPYCTVELPHSALGDAQISAECVVNAIRSMHAVAGRRVDVVGHSQGGMLPRWALKYWPDTRAMVDDLVGIAASNHGTPDADGMCVTPCQPSVWQQRSASAFLAALNADAETWAGISYTSIYTHTDEVVLPNLDDTGSTSLHTGEGAITNVAIQDICPLAVTEHIGTYDPVAYAIAVDALEHTGPADPSRVSNAVCTQLLMPGVDPSTFATSYAAAVADIGANLASEERVGAEPALRCYVTGSCPAAPAAPPPSPTPAAPSPSPAAGVQAGRLAATGADLDGRAAPAALLVALVLATTVIGRRARA